MVGFYENHDGKFFPYGLLLVRHKHYVRRVVRSTIEGPTPAFLGLTRDDALEVLVRHLSQAWLETDYYANHL